MAGSADIREIVEPVLEGLGYELVRISLAGGNRPTLQVMAERADGGMGVDDCARISRELSAVLDVEDPIASQYVLEISSPGIDRPLTREKDFERFRGFEAKIETRAPRDGRRRFKGRLGGVKEGQIILELDDQSLAFSFDDIQKAKLVLTDELIAADTPPAARETESLKET